MIKEIKAMNKKINVLLAAAMTMTAIVACSNGGNSSAGQPSFKSIETGFLKPDTMPLGVYWYWISDNISKEGVIKDLEAMKQAGITRAFVGNVQEGASIDAPVHKLFTPEWWDITHAAMKRAGELGIEIGMFNSPGWSQSGGPWVKPEQSMRYLASSMHVVKGPQKNAVITLPEVAKDAMADVKIIACPSPSTTSATVKSVSLNKIRGEEMSLDIPLPKGMTVRNLTLKFPQPVYVKSGIELYATEGGKERLLRKFDIDRTNASLNVGFDPYAPIVISLPENTAEKLRFAVKAHAAEFKAELLLSDGVYVERYPEKTLAKMFQTPLPMWHDYLWEKQPEAPASLCIDPAKVLDITAKVKDGVLTWDVPEGEWLILRTAMRSTQVTNGPASKEGTGLEIDKINKQHIASHFDAFIGEMLRRIPASDRKSFKVVVEDSYETGGLNWTDDMGEKFKQVYGYDPTPYLPTLSGLVVGSQDISDRFLWDLRRLIADRVAYDYVGGMREVSNKNGLTTWLENYGHWGFPSEFLMYGGQSDEIGGEFWSEGSLGDIENHAAASCAHTYGKKRVWAESCTSGGPVFSRYPNIMKPRLDRFFTEGVNSTLLHVYIQQPREDLSPGIDAWFGNEFNRKNTWFAHMDVFAKYLKRCNWMLQQGLFTADVAYFIGEDAPKMTGVRDPALPKGYAFDYINAEVLMTRASVKDGKLTLPDGMQYSLLVLPKLETMRPEVLQKIKELVEEGLVISGTAPSRSPSLQNYPEADGRVQALAAELWGPSVVKKPNNGTSALDAIRGTSAVDEKAAADTLANGRPVGKGKVFGADKKIEDVFAIIGVQPDVLLEGSKDAKYIHRRLPDGDIYFISNQSGSVIDLKASFRVSGKVPELWDPLTEEIRDLKNFERTATTTVVPIQMQPSESAFIVFRKKGSPSKSFNNYPALKTLVAINTPWNVALRNEMTGFSKTLTMDALEDWSKSSDTDLRYFSGLATYTTKFTLPEKPGSKPLYLSLGEVMVTAKVKINGVYAGGIWAFPYRLNATELLKKGENTIEVEVANNWMNRLIGDQMLPEAERKTWAKVNPWKADSKLQKSGLIGPVEIKTFE